VDLGESWRLSVDHYCLRSDGNRGSHKPRNWELQGASSPAGPWTTLRRHDNDAALGDESAPFQSIHRALAATRAAKVSAPKSIVLQAGVVSTQVICRCVCRP
jgi:hypothetical protein